MKSIWTPALLGWVFCASACKEEPKASPAESDDVKAELQLRKERDQTVWANETTAQKYEQVFVELWDQIRDSDNKLKTLSELSFNTFNCGSPIKNDPLDQGMQRISFSEPSGEPLAQAEVAKRINDLSKGGLELVESEWHHYNFTPPTKDSPAQSVISIALHLKKKTGELEDRFIIRSKLHVTWSGDSESPAIDHIEAHKLRILERRDIKPAFVQRLKISKGPHPLPTSHPLILNDLDDDGLSEIIVPRWNALYRNGGQGRFTFEKMCVTDTPLWEAGVIADLNGDSLPDLFAISAETKTPLLFPGVAGGKFAEKPLPCGDATFDYPSAITAGDIDGDGDLDLWATQYKPPYNEGQMPTPYYDANDGYPSYLLLNDGKGNFTDHTKAAGLTAKRHRRTYSASFVDLDNDQDLDLMVVSDFAGLDLYHNNGSGIFTECTSDWVGPRHSFGMGHVLDDFDKDGHQDFYVIGMSSTTARRLDQMRLSRDDHPDIAEKRSEMGYGNRMYLGNGKTFKTPDFAAHVARTGWSWGVTSFDFDNDGDRDLYVANGHRSGQSSKDYCAKYWCHDIYTGSSKNSPVIKNVLATSMFDLNEGKISWNGYEKNALLNNLDGKDFANVSFLFGSSFSYDARAVVSDDLDADGRPDLLVAQMGYNPVTKFEMTYFGYRNTLETGNEWIGVRLRNGGPGRSPIGAKVIVHSSVGKQSRQLVTGDSYLSQHANTLHFGLGKGGSVERIEVIWPNGERDEITSPANRTYHRFGAKN